MEDIWKNVNVVIKEKGLRKYMVAERMGISKQCFSSMQKRSPKVSSLERIAAVLNVKVIDFFIQGKDRTQS